MTTIEASPTATVSQATLRVSPMKSAGRSVVDVDVVVVYKKSRPLG